MSAVVQWCKHSLASPFFGIGMEIDLFQYCGHCWVFQICWHIECSTFIASTFRIWNSSTGISSPLLALFIVMFPKALLTSLSRMSGSRWVITPSLLSVITPSLLSITLGEWLHHHYTSLSWRSFLHSSFVYSCHFFLIFPASVRSMPFLSFFVPIFAWNFLLVSLIFFKRSLVFPILLFSSTSLYWSLRKAFFLYLLFFGTLHSNGYIFPFLLCLSLLFFSQLFVRPPQTTI